MNLLFQAYVEGKLIFSFQRVAGAQDTPWELPCEAPALRQAQTAAGAQAPQNIKPPRSLLASLLGAPGLGWFGATCVSVQCTMRAQRAVLS